MKARLIALLLGAFISLSSQAQSLQSIALNISRNYPFEQSAPHKFRTIYQDKKTLQLQESFGEDGVRCYDFALWRSEEMPQTYLIALAYREKPLMSNGELLFFYHSFQSNTQTQINPLIKIRTHALHNQDGASHYWRRAMGILKGGTIWQNASVSMASTDYVFYRKREGKDAFETIPYMTLYSPILVDNEAEPTRKSPYIDQELRPYVERINRSKTLQKRSLLTATEQREYLPDMTFFFEGNLLVKAVHLAQEEVTEYYFQDHSLLFIYNKTKTKEHRIYLNKGVIVRYLGDPSWNIPAIESLYDKLIHPLILKL